MRGQERGQAAKESRAIHDERKKDSAWLKNMPHRPHFVENLYADGLIRPNATSRFGGKKETGRYQLLLLKLKPACWHLLRSLAAKKDARVKGKRAFSRLESR
jgi:hypothetical protein